MPWSSNRVPSFPFSFPLLLFVRGSRRLPVCAPSIQFPKGNFPMVAEKYLQGRPDRPPIPPGNKRKVFLDASYRPPESRNRLFLVVLRPRKFLLLFRLPCRHNPVFLHLPPPFHPRSRRLAPPVRQDVLIHLS